MIADDDPQMNADADATATKLRATAALLELAFQRGDDEVSAERTQSAELIAQLQGAADCIELQALLLEAKDEQIARQSEMLRAIGYPLLRVAEGVLCVPVIGPLDLERTQRLMSTLLSGAVEGRARDAIVDLTGAEIADVSVTETLVNITRALSLVGVSVAICGIRPDVAQTLADQRAMLSHVAMYPTLQATIAAIAARRASQHSSRAPRRQRGIGR